jgi:hypothetical protein
MLSLAGVLIIYYLKPTLLQVHFAYFVLGSMAFLQFAYIIYRHPKLLPKLLSMMPFFFFVYLSFELTARSLSQWTFPGQYIGMVWLGGITFPVEELFFWIMVSSAVAASYHEMFVDDLK